VALSLDSGATWAPAAMPGRANSTMWSFACHPADEQLIYSASVSGQVYRSTDGGATWAKLGREFGEVRALAFAPGGKVLATGGIDQLVELDEFPAAMALPNQGMDVTGQQINAGIKVTVPRRLYS